MDHQNGPASSRRVRENNLYPEGISVPAIIPHGPTTRPRATRATDDTQVIRMWLHRKSEQTIRAYSRDVKEFFSFAACTLAEVHLEDVQAFADSLVDDLSP